MENIIISNTIYTLKLNLVKNYFKNNLKCKQLIEVSMNEPIYLTDEEIKELDQLWKDYHIQSSSGWDKWRESDWFYDYDDGFPGSTRKRHEWVPVMLLNHTVYDCKHCGVHKDKAKGDFCDEEFKL